jgi:hypothetical protein
MPIAGDERSRLLEQFNLIKRRRMLFRLLLVLWTVALSTAFVGPSMRRTGSSACFAAAPKKKAAAKATVETFKKADLISAVSEATELTKKDVSY